MISHKNSFKPLKPIKSIELPKIKDMGDTPKRQSLKEWAMAGGGVPDQYKGREHVWHAKVNKFAEGGEVRMAKGGKVDDEGAAFGAFPQMKPKRSKQDREAAKNVPVDLARGAVAGTLGMPGDIESLLRIPYDYLRAPTMSELVTGDKTSKTFLPTSEDIEKRLPFRSEAPVNKAASELGILGGGLYTGPLSGARAATAVPKAVVRAGRDFVMASAAGVPHVVMPTARIGLEAPGILIPSKMNNVREAVRNIKGNYGARRVERAADEIPNLEKMYQEDALKQAFTGDNAAAMMTLNPARFEEYATPINSTFTRPNSVRHTSSGERVTYPEYIEYLKSVGGFDDVPFLQINKQLQGTEATPFISGHEGRHRNRALSESGEKAGLVQLLPRSELREPFPRRTQEDYIEALRKELEMTGNIVLPQMNPNQPHLPQRKAIDLPDIYAKGGEVRMAGGGLSQMLKK
jgi:hypothetical protein